MSTIKRDYYELLKPLVYTITGIEVIFLFNKFKII